MAVGSLAEANQDFLWKTVRGATEAQTADARAPTALQRAAEDRLGCHRCRVHKKVQFADAPGQDLPKQDGHLGPAHNVVRHEKESNSREPLIPLSREAHEGRRPAANRQHSGT